MISRKYGAPLRQLASPDPMISRTGKKVRIEEYADALAVEVKIAPRDIEQVYVGQTASMRFAAFDQKTTPGIEGEVSMVSAETTQDQRTGTSYYIARVQLAAEQVAKMGDAKLLPGMPVEVLIATDKRTVLSYLVRPLGDQFMHTFRER